ncbi:MAG TPA: transposase [Bacilli bacterium]|nr:transposase [Bacilli bacterium]
MIKREWLNRFIIKNLDHAHKFVFEYIEAFYNTVRLHNFVKWFLHMITKKLLQVKL